VLWAAGTSPVVLVPGTGRTESELSAGLARAGFAVVSWPDSGLEDIRRVAEAITTGALSIAAPTYALCAADSALDAALWTAATPDVKALVTFEMLSRAGERELPITDTICCPWLLFEPDDDQSVWARASALAANGQRHLEPLHDRERALRVAIQWLARRL